MLMLTGKQKILSVTDLNPRLISSECVKLHTALLNSNYGLDQFATVAAGLQWMATLPNI